MTRGDKAAANAAARKRLKRAKKSKHYSPVITYQLTPSGKKKLVK